METISVIVPVYNTAEYLSVCVNSILGQTYQDLEILLIDDGSTDGSGAMCDAYAAEHARVRVIHQPNGGMSIARNTGLNAAGGAFISFVDSDDYIHPRFLESLKNAIDFFDTDAAECDFTRVHETVPFEPISSLRIEVSDTEKLVSSLARFNMYGPVRSHWPVIWNKLYRRAFIQDLRFVEGIMHEDEFFINDLVFKFPKIALIAEPLYFYRRRPGSVMSYPIEEKRLVVYEALSARQEFVKRYFPHLERAGRRHNFGIYCFHFRHTRDRRLLKKYSELFKPRLRELMLVRLRRVLTHLKMIPRIDNM